MRKLKSALVLAALFGTVGVAQANMISNGSFENVTSGTAFDSYYGAAIPSDGGLQNWQVVGSVGVVLHQNSDTLWADYSQTSTSYGNRFLNLAGWDSAPGAMVSGVQQSVNTVAGRSYNVSFSLGNEVEFNGGLGNSIQVSALGNSGVIGSQSFASSGTESFSWSGNTFSFVANSSLSTITFTATGTRNYFGLDNVIMTDVTVPAVPEPGTYAMLLAGLGLMGAIARRRQQK